MRWWCAGLLALATQGALASERVRLNEATADELVRVVGVEQAVADQVVALRSSRGRLGSVEELRILPSVPEAALDRLRDGTWVDFELAVGSTRAFGSAAEVLATFDGEPAVSVVQGWASTQAQVAPETVQRWLRASRGFAALPELRVEYRLADDYGNNFQTYDLDGNPPTSNDVDVQDVLTDADVGQTRTIVVRATWDLDKLVMSSEQIRVINEGQDVVKLREKVLGEVTRLYFERRRLQVDMLLAPKSDLMGQVRDELRLRELTAGLDAYTGGRFSAAVAKR